MSRTHFLTLFFLGLIVPVLIAQFQPAPGYLDSDYYFAGGVQLAMGKGFTEPYLWNYLDGSTSLPHPSHGYWQPLASIVAALGMWLTGKTTYASGRLFFFLIAALVPPVTAALAFTFSKRRDLAFTSGLLAVFCVYNAPFLGVTDNFGLFMLFGGLYFLTVTRLIEDPTRARNWLLLGVFSGLLTLSRSDGLLWLGVTFLFVLSSANLKPSTFNIKPSTSNLTLTTRNAFLSFLGFLLIMSPWYWRNFNMYGSMMSPGSSLALWLNDYDQTFTYPPALLNAQSFFALGWREILADRLWAFGVNLQSGFAAHGGIILFPFIIAGIFYYWKDARVKLGSLAWLILLFVMSFVFPFAGARGAFFHAGAALQPLWWTLAPLGLEAILFSLQYRKIGNSKNRVVFRGMLVMVTIILTVYVVNLRLFVLGWGEGESKYPAVEQFLVQQGIQPTDIVIVRNPPGYYLETGRSALPIPYGGADVILQVARQFGADYLVYESLGHDPTQKKEHLLYLGEVNGAFIYQIEQ